MSSRRVLALALRIIRQFARDRRSLALLFLAPLLVMTLLNFLLGSGGSGFTLGVVSPSGPAGEAILTQLSSRLSNQAGVTVKAISRDGVDTALKNGDADGVLIFPASYDPTTSPASITLRLDGSKPGEAQQIRALVSQLLTGLPGAQAVTPPASSDSLTVSYLYGGPQYTQTDALAPLFVALFAFFFVFLLTSVSFLRERSQGTIERLMVSPLSKTELVLGYVLGFTLFAMLQSLIILLFVVYVLRVHYAGNLGLIFLMTLALTIGAVNMGIFASAFARNELQVIQLIPVLLVPQILLGGLFFPVATLPVVLKQLAYVFPLTYANNALRDVMLKGFGLGDIWPDLVFVAGFAAVMVLAAALSMRQERL
ncbi:MAG TPA: ABC transporter permease [Ktedonobacterales bacterium]|nr:ABC transporter permease [Ktedonobacterales bacterium]